MAFNTTLLSSSRVELVTLWVVPYMNITFLKDTLGIRIERLVSEYAIWLSNFSVGHLLEANYQSSTTRIEATREIVSFYFRKCASVRDDWWGYWWYWERVGLDEPIVRSFQVSNVMTQPLSRQNKSVWKNIKVWKALHYYYQNSGNTLAICQMLFEALQRYLLM